MFLRWSDVAPPNAGRHSHICGVVTNPVSGEEEVVVAGGSSGNSGDYLDSVSIYSVARNEWRRGSGMR